MNRRCFCPPDSLAKGALRFSSSPSWASSTFQSAAFG